ncbi:MAG: hypothetical protein FWG51_05650, partial [Firmicutes bacterium]|nr:hypothetical protein [Bacillota bacterium]
EFLDLIEIKTTIGTTILSNSSGAWMDGIIGPVIDYEIRLGDNCENVDGDPGDVLATISVLNIKDTVTASAATTSDTAAWTISGLENEWYFYMGSTVGNSTNRSAKDILFSAYNLIQQYAQEDGGVYYLEIDIVFNDTPIFTVTVQGENPALISGILQSSEQFLRNSSATLVADFDSVLYEFETWLVWDGGIDSVYSPSKTLTIIMTDDILLSYTITPKEYSVQILGKTTNNGDVFIGDEIKYGYGDPIFYNSTDLMTLDIGELVIEQNYFLGSMIFEDIVFYVFDHFELNGIEVSDNEIIDIDSDALHDNQRLGGYFTVYAVYQKKYIVNISFDDPDGQIYVSGYELFVGNGTRSEEYDGVDFDGFAVNESETIVLEIKPDKRYEFDALSDDGDLGKIVRSTGNTVYIFLPLEHSLDMTVNLINANIRVDLIIDILDSNSYATSALGYISANGGLSKIDHVSVSAGAVTNLTLNSIVLTTNDYRSLGLKIYNFISQEYDLLEDAFLGDKIIVNDDFFNKYLDENGNSIVCLFVIKQYLVDVSRPGFTQNGDTFKNDDLGSYTVAFSDGQCDSLGNGQYMVDYDTKVTLVYTEGEYGKFIDFAGLSEQENEALSFTVKSDRFVGINFESTKLAAWIMPTIYGGAAVLAALLLMTLILVMRSSKLKRLKIKAEKDMKDMMRKFNLSAEIEQLRSGDFESTPQGQLEKYSKKKK